MAAAAGAPGDARDTAAAVVAPFDVVAAGFDDPSGLAVDAAGGVLVTDRRAGTLTRITGAGARQIILNNLQEPVGVATSSEDVFLLERARVLRLEPGGLVSVVAELPGRGRGIAAGPDGRVWIAARHEDGTNDEILHVGASGALSRVAAGFIYVRALAAAGDGIYVAASSVAGQAPGRTPVVRLPWRTGGGLGPAEGLLQNTRGLPKGIAIDAAGEVFVTGWLTYPYPASGVVLKRRAGGEIGLVAFGLSPGAAAFGPERDLFVIDHRSPARVLRFRAPAPPAASVAPFTNRSPLQIAGHAQANSLVHVANAGVRVAASAADPATGSFVVRVPLAENAESHLSIVATANAGNGLVGLPAVASIVHDDHLPRVEILEPPDAVHVRNGLAARARAADAGSGMATLTLMVDELPQAAVPAASDGESLTATAMIDMTAFREGPHTLTAAALDRAGNWASAARLIVVDRTPPDTFILTEPPLEAADGSAIFTFGGWDEQSADLEFAWRLDAGPWSSFSSAAAVQLTGLSGGAHRFDVAARDRAGNVDPTPAAQAFVVRELRVHIVEPLADAVITTGTVWVRGTVDSGPDVALSIPLPPALQQAVALEALPVPHEAGTFALELPVVAEMSVITVVGRDGAGAQSRDAVPVSVQGPLSPLLRLESFPAAGLAPLTVRFSGSGFRAGSVYSLDLDSDGIADDEGNALPDREFVYMRPGIHVATLQAITPAGVTLVARGSIEVYDRARLEARLRGVWTGFKAAMRAGDAAAAASFVHGGRRAAWAEYFGRLTPTQFAAVDAMFTDLTLLDVSPGRAEGEMMRDEDGLLYSFPVSFEIDVDGGWKLWQF